MSAEENKALVRRCLADVWDGGRLERVDDLLAESFVRHGPSATEGEIRGRDGFKRLVSMYRATYPDLRVPIEDQVAEGDLVVTRWTARGTHRGELMGIAPTGNPVSVSGMILDRVVDGRIVEEWASYDALGMLRQLGAIPAPG